MSTKKKIYPLYPQKFRSEWKKHPKLKDWVCENVVTNRAFCMFCHCTVRGKLSALVAHAETKKHQAACEDPQNQLCKDRQDKARTWENIMTEWTQEQKAGLALKAEIAEKPTMENCLTCLQVHPTKTMHLVSSGGRGGENLTEKIEVCGGIRLLKHEKFPTKICARCYALLNVAHEFRIGCQKAQEQLRQQLKLPPLEREAEEILLQFNVEPGSGTIVVDGTAEEEYLMNFEEGMTEEELVVEDAEDEVIDEIIEELGEEDGVIIKVEDDFENVTEEFQPLSNIQEEQGEIAAGIGFVIDHEHVNVEENPPKPDIKCEEHTESISTIKVKKIAIYPPPSEKSTAKPNRIGSRLGKVKTARKEPRRKDPYICHECGNRYPDGGRLTTHLKTHKPKDQRDYLCEICSKRFSSARQLQIHMNSHTRQRPYKCKYCPASFGDPSSLIRHERVHENIRPYKCEDCDKSFSYGYGLRKHMRIHSGEKPFSCDYCEKQFTLPHHKKAHELTHSKRTNLEFLNYQKQVAETQPFEY